MDILGIGNALLDIFCFSDEDLSLPLGLHPNRAAHMSPERLDELLIAIPNPIYAAGGCAPNALKAASALGLECAFVGCVGTEDREDDRWARLFLAHLEVARVRSVVVRRTRTTGRCLVIRMPGGMKAIACSPGAAPTLSPDEIDESLARRAKTVFVDGQTLRNDALFARIAELCRKHAVPLAVDVASAEIARERCGAIAGIVADLGATVFLNEDEGHAFARALEALNPGLSGSLQPEDRLDRAFAWVSGNGLGTGTVVMKRGERGASLWDGTGRIDAETEAIENPLDDTGAGDTFAGAFLAARLLGESSQAALGLANGAARECLSVPGTRIEAEALRSLRRVKP